METRFIRGITVHTSHGITEPSSILSENQAYELIYHPNGELSKDWECKHKVNLTNHQTK